MTRPRPHFAGRWRAYARWSDMPIAIQLAHAGRKASSEVPWKGGAQILPSDPNGWQTVAPSAVPFADGQVAPLALDRDGLARVRDAFAAAATRAARLGLDAVQIHGAHGYLLHEFLSPLSNRREDEYGGSLENRMRFPLEVFEAVRAAFPTEKPVTMRVSGMDWVEGGWDIEQTIAFAERLQALGCDAVHVSSGGLFSRTADPDRAGLSGAARPRRQGGGPHAGDRGGDDQQLRACRGDRRDGGRRSRRAGAGDALRPALAMARRRRAGRQGARAQPVSALRATAGQRIIRGHVIVRGRVTDRQRRHVSNSFANPSAAKPLSSPDHQRRRIAMTKVTYVIVEHDGGWAYKVGDVFSETFPSHDEAYEAADRAAREQTIAGETTPIEYEDRAGKWHEETAPGDDRPETEVKD